jgi:exopolyphosphatase/guanosine-5'-triphosphate,3'-diphosphate pyrophosphatase
MIAQPKGGHLRIVDSFSRIVRLGEGLSQSRRLDEHAMERTIRALKLCAEKIDRRGVTKIRAVATQACRIAQNGKAFVARIRAETGLDFSIITPQQEAALAVLGCASLLDPAEVPRQVNACMVIDVGGGSTEISWVNLIGAENWTHKVTAVLRHGEHCTATNHLSERAKRLPRPDYYVSIPIGVVNLAEHHPEPCDTDRRSWFENMVAEVISALGVAAPPPMFLDSCAQGKSYIVGTSGAITSLAGLHLGLERYDRAQVDGLWMQRHECHRVLNRLLSLNRQERENEPCIGKDRADLVMAGAAILEAVQRMWPCEDLRVADRGLREGILLSMLKKRTKQRPRRRRKLKTTVAQEIKA